MITLNAVRTDHTEQSKGDNVSIRRMVDNSMGQLSKNISGVIAHGIIEAARPYATLAERVNVSDCQPLCDELISTFSDNLKALFQKTTEELFLELALQCQDAAEYLTPNAIEQASPAKNKVATNTPATPSPAKWEKSKRQVGGNGASQPRQKIKTAVGGSNGTLDHQNLIRWLRANDFTLDSKHANEMVFRHSSGGPVVSVPGHRGDIKNGTAASILRALSDIYGCRMVAQGGQPVAFN